MPTCHESPHPKQVSLVSLVRPGLYVLPLMAAAADGGRRKLGERGALRILRVMQHAERKRKRSWLVAFWRAGTAEAKAC
ncbi:MAG TPA: hypothetical protein VFN67_16090 [Polyangiales bacterium]|nr:hypothetical protein [Polyangiales bacterium]